MIYKVLVTQQDADRISIFRMSPQSGMLTLEREVQVPGGPAPLAVDPLQRYLYVGLRERPALAAMRLDPTAGLLDQVEVVDLAEDPCYISTDRTGRFVLSAYYGAGCCAVHRVRADGGLQPDPLQWIETAPHAHCVQTDPSNRFAYLPHTVPANEIRQYRFDVESGQLQALQPRRAPVEAGVGPRHYDYHPHLDRVYFSNEQGSSVSVYALDRSNGQLDRLQTLSTLPEDWQERNTCAQIHLDPQGRWLYVSNRGHDTLAIFRVDADTGLLTAVGHQPTEPIPRVFGIDPLGRHLYVAGQGSNRLAAYSIDRMTGLLSEIATYPLGKNPMWVLFLSMDAER